MRAVAVDNILHFEHIFFGFTSSPASYPVNEFLQWLNVNFSAQLPLATSADLLVYLPWDRIAFTVLTLLVGCQEEHLAYKKCGGAGMAVWLEEMHVVQLMPFPPVISCSIGIQNGLPFWCRLTQLDVEKRLLNGCCCYCGIEECSCGRSLTHGGRNSSTVIVSCQFHSRYLCQFVLACTATSAHWNILSQCPTWWSPCRT